MIGGEEVGERDEGVRDQKHLRPLCKIVISALHTLKSPQCVHMCVCACMHSRLQLLVSERACAFLLPPVAPINEKGNFSVLPSHWLPSLVATVTGGNDTFGGADVYFC